MVKSHNKLGMVGSQHNIVKARYDKPISKIIMNRQTVKAFPLKSGRRLFIVNIELEFLARTTQKENEIKWKPDMGVHTGNTRYSGG
jgi:hypothetical protein